MAVEFRSVRKRGQQGEARLVNEWLRMNHPNDLQWKRVRLGPIPETEFANMYKVAQRWTDAIVLKDDVVLIIEAKMKPDASAIGQLELYARLLPQTPEFSQLKFDQVKLLMLTTRADAALEDMCAAKGIEYVIYKPEWLKE